MQISWDMFCFLPLILFETNFDDRIFFFQLVIIQYSFIIALIICYISLDLKVFVIFFFFWVPIDFLIKYCAFVSISSYFY